MLIITYNVLKVFEFFIFKGSNNFLNDPFRYFFTQIISNKGHKDTKSNAYAEIKL